MRFLIFGAGAIGSAIAGKLALAGHEVHIVARQRHVEKIKKDGLRITGIWGNILVKNIYAHTSPPYGEYFDVTFVTVKTFSTGEAGRTLKEHEVKSKVFISAQNGLGNHEILSMYVRPVACARVIFGVVFDSPGNIKVTVWGGPILLGFPDGTEDGHSFLEKVSETLRDAGLDSKFTSDIKTPLWEKTIYNSALNPLSVIMNAKYGEIVSNPHSLEIVKRVIDEGVKVGRAEGAKLKDDFFSYFMNEMIPPTRDHISSMIQDMKMRGRTEIDSMCGAIFRYGMKHNIDAVTNFTLWKIIKSLERR